MIQALKTFVGGFLMGSADLVPGVSGGTIALVLGIYERLVASIREGSSALGTMFKADFEAARNHLAKVEWAFLVPLLLGILTAVLTLANLLEHQLEENPEVLAAAFFGLVVGSVAIAWRLLRSPHSRHVVIAVVVGAILFWLLGLGEEATIQDPGMVAFLGAGALAICAMILPGISGSLILLLVGMYPAVLAAVNDRDYAAVGMFVVGAIVGLALFSQVLYWALRNHHDVVLAGLIGLMAGSLRVLWPWPGGVDSSALGPPEGDLLPVILAFVVGLALVIVISRLAGQEDETSIEPLSIR